MIPPFSLYVCRRNIQINDNTLSWKVVYFSIRTIHSLHVRPFLLGAFYEGLDEMPSLLCRLQRPFTIVIIAPY